MRCGNGVLNRRDCSLNGITWIGRMKDERILRMIGSKGHLACRRGRKIRCCLHGMVFQREAQYGQTNQDDVFNQKCPSNFNYPGKDLTRTKYYVNS